MKTCTVNNGKVVFDIDGRTRHFTLDAGSEIVYYAMHFWSHEEIIEALNATPETAKLLKYLPGYQQPLIEAKESHTCPTCNRPL